MIKILKKNGELQNFNGEKIKRAIRKSAERVCITLTPTEEKKVVDTVRKQLQYNDSITLLLASDTTIRIKQ